MTNNILNRHTAPKAEAPERVIQFGEGNFLRAFVDWMIQEMNDKTAFNGSVVIVQPRERNHIETLRAQDCLYHVNLLGLKGNEQVNTCQRISSVSRALNPYTQYDAFMALAEQPEMRFVISNTTEAGIAFDNTCKLSDTPPASYPAKLTQLLYRRYTCFNGDAKKGLIILPCELIFGNGHHLKECINQYIDLWHDDLDDAEGFRKWVASCCPICTTLVDRIVNSVSATRMPLWCKARSSTSGSSSMTRTSPSNSSTRSGRHAKQNSTWCSPTTKHLITCARRHCSMVRIPCSRP